MVREKALLNSKVKKITLTNNQGVKIMEMCLLKIAQGKIMMTSTASLNTLEEHWEN